MSEETKASSRQRPAVSKQPSAAPTPGPWKVVESPAAVKNRCIVRKERQGTCLLSRHIATVSVHGPDAENEANARLLAAAPDLLAACQRALEWLVVSPGGASIAETCAAVRAAIAKAEGMGTP